VDFDRLNAGAPRFTVGAVNVRTGNFVYFDNTTHTILPEHVMASGALPPGFPAIEIEGEHYWDGGLVSNTPLQWVVEGEPRRDTLAFQVDLWNARGEFPRNMLEVVTREKEIRYSSRTRAGTDQFKHVQKMRRAVAGRRTISAVRADTMPIPIGSYHPALGVTLSLPSIVGSGGVVSVLSPDLSTEEQRELEESASTLRRATKSISC
jgi:predicted acylesterase/phospholipase RssA